MKVFLTLGLIVVYTFFGWIYCNAQSYGNVTCNASAHVNNGTVPTGCKGLVFVCGSGATCAVAGATLPANTILTVPIPAQSRVNDLQYTVSGGTLWSIECR